MTEEQKSDDESERVRNRAPETAQGEKSTQASETASGGGATKGSATAPGDESTKASETASGDESTKVSKKASKKDFWKHELRELSIIFSYLFACFSVVMSFKALVLMQHGVEDFGHMYAVAAVEAIALGKIVALAQDLPLMDAWNAKPMIYSVLYKSVLMAILVYLGGAIEEKIFHHAAEVVPHPWLLFVSHELAFLFIFIVLFTVREVDRTLGPGKLFAMVFGPRSPQSAQPGA